MGYLLSILLTFFLIHNLPAVHMSQLCYSTDIVRTTTTSTTTTSGPHDFEQDPDYGGHYVLHSPYNPEEYPDAQSDFNERSVVNSYTDDPCSYSPSVTIDVMCETILMSHSKYQAINTICSQDRVRFFYQYGTKISILPGSAFVADFEISELHLSNLGLIKIAPGAFNKQPKIDVIYMDGNNLSQIGVGLFNSLSYLDKIDLSDNQIINISEEAFSSTPLKKLYLSKNKLTFLPDTLAEIEILDVSYNKIKEIQPSTYFHTIHLNASNNVITKFNFTKFPQIQELYLANNEMEEIDITNGSVNLKKLDLYNNKLSRLPENLSKFEVLNVGANAISNLPNKTLNASLLTELNLSANNLTYIPSLSFKLLDSLEILDLSKNSISSFTFGTFDGLDHLRILNISYNRFKILPFRTFHAMKTLNSIDFSGNQINDLNIYELFKHLPYLKSLDLRNNVLSCHKLLEIVHTLEIKRVTFIRGNDIDDDNIYGIKCTNLDELIDVREKTDSNQSNPSYSALINYFNTGFENSSFARYLGDLKNSSNRSEVLSDIKQFLNELMQRDRKQNDFFEKLTKELKLNLNNTDNNDAKHRVLEFERILNENDRHSNMSMEMDKKLNEALNRIAVELNAKNVNKEEFYKTLLSLRQILNDTYSSDKNNREYLSKKFSDLDIDIRNLLETLKITQQNDFKFLLNLLEKNQSNARIFLPDISENNSLNFSHTEKVGMPLENEVSGRTSPVFILIAILLVIITVLLVGFGYVMLFRIKYIVNNKPDVELTRLVDSKRNDVCE